MVRALVFDVDGTLVTFAFDIIATRKAMIAELGRRGYDVSAISTNTLSQVILDVAKSQIDSGHVSDDFEELKARYFSILDEYELLAAKVAKPFDGTVPTLSELKNSSIRLGALTNSGRLAANWVFRKNQLSEYFEFLLTRDDVAAMKPRPDGIVKALSLLNLPASEVVYVGDSLYDIKAAKSAGVRVASIASGVHTLDRLMVEDPDFLLASIADVPKII